MDLRNIEYFVTICEEGSISKAANRFFVSQSALSQQLAKLEKDLGFPLFYRNHKGLIMTEIGKVYYEGCKEILAIREKTTKRIEDVLAASQKKILVAAAPGRCTELFSNILPSFINQCPNISLSLVEVTSMQSEKMVVDGSCDFCLTLLNETERNSHLPFQYHSLFIEELRFIISKSNHLLQSDPLKEIANTTRMLTPKDIHLFENESFVLPYKPTKARLFASDFLQQQGITPKILFETMNTSFILSSIAGTDLCSIIMSGFLKNNDSSISFRFEQPYTSALSICWNRQRELSQTDLSFIDLCQAYVDTHWK